MEVTREIELEAPPDEVWSALTEPEQLEEWFANDVELELEPGSEGVFRWGNGEERRAIVEEVDPERRLALRWEDEGRVSFTLEELPAGTRLTVTESSPQWSIALELRALAACAAA